MKSYDPGKPLIFSHVPKTAGTSVRELFSGWYGPNLLLHYRGGKNRPPVHDLDHPPEPGKPVAVYGHFNRSRGVGIDKYYPQVDQFITILRDPLERAISTYFFKKQHPTWWSAYLGTASMTLDEFISRWPGLIRGRGGPIANFLPGKCSRENYKEIFESRFIEVGVTEHLDISMSRIADKLGFEFEAPQLQRLNAAKRTREVSEEVKAKFKTRNPLEYEIYNYARDRLLK